VKRYLTFSIPPGVCDEIVKVAREHDSMDARLTGADPYVDHVARKTEVVWLPHGWYDGIMTEIGMSANLEFGFDISDGEDIQVGWYEEGGHYGFHSDVDPYNTTRGYHRKVTIVLCLEDEYEGGELEFNFGKENATLKLKKGEAVAFPSWLLHKVHPVTSGTRATAVKWLTGPFWR
jgi:PKHD-type hydroxylase